MKNLLIRRDDAVAVCVDFQGKLANGAYGATQLKDKIVRLAKCLRIMEVPILVTQHYTQGLGDTEEAVKKALGDFKPIEKITFSCTETSEFMEKLKETGKKNVILFGIETHICVLQTALYLKEAGYEVWTIADCCSSRTKQDNDYGINRMISSGINVTTYESAIFEMLITAEADEFKQISGIVK